MIRQSQVKPEECSVFLCTIRVGRMLRILKLAAVASILAISGNISQAQTDFEGIVRNIEPIGQVCLAGQACAGGTTNAATSTVAAAVTQSAPAAATAFDAAATYQQSCFACRNLCDCS